MPQDLSAVAWPVRTERLCLRPAAAADVEATWQIRRLPEVSHWLTAQPTDRDSYEEKFSTPTGSRAPW